MSIPYIQPYLDVVKYLTKELGLSLYSRRDGFEVYRIELRGHIITVQIKIDDCVDGLEIESFLNINDSNIWWHIRKEHSGYSVSKIEDFVNIDFVRIMIRNSHVFKELWKDYSDL